MKPAFRMFPVFLVAGQMTFADMAKELTSQQLEDVRSGEQISILEDVEGGLWPRVTIYQVIKASPEEVMAVFFDYEQAFLYVPNLLKSHVARELLPGVKEVDYGVDVPILPDEFYTVRNRLTSSGPNAYCVDWKLVKALQTKDSVGDFSVELLGEEAIVRYRNFTTPGSSMAVLLKGSAIDRMKKTVQAICRQVQNQKSQHPEALQQQVEALRASLKK